MIIKNVAKTVIGNEKFLLLPGETMEVEGSETWVKNYVAGGKLQEIKAAEVSETDDDAAEKAAKEEEEKAAAEKAAKALKTARNKILKSGTDEEVFALAAELGIETADQSRDELVELIKKAI